MPAPDIIHQLVKRFEEHKDSYHSGKAIDRLVYELYGLTEDDVKVVEGG